MRITPSNLDVAKSSAKNLRIQLESFLGITLPLQKSRELYARALGYAHWAELAGIVDKPHKTLYLPDLPDGQQGQEELQIYTRLASMLGFDYMHGMVIRAAEQAALGYDIQTAAILRSLCTPWGLIDEQKTMAPGIQRVYTASHGGYRLDAACRTHMDHLFASARAAYPASPAVNGNAFDFFEQRYVPELDKEWYEEDCEARLVEAAFPDFFGRARAESGLRSTYPHLLEFVFGIAADEYDKREDTRLLDVFRSSPELWFAVDDLGHQNHLEGLRWGYYALMGADAAAWFNLKDVQASERGRYFVSDGKRFLKTGEPIPDSFEAFPDQSMGRGPELPDFDLIGMGGEHSPEKFRARRMFPSRHGGF
jgi:hypothetical protein